MGTMGGLDGRGLKQRWDFWTSKIVSEYDEEIPQSHTADQLTAPQRATKH